MQPQLCGCFFILFKKEPNIIGEGTLRRTLSTPGLYLIFLKRIKTYCSLRPKNQSLRGAQQLAPLNPQPPLCFLFAKHKACFSKSNAAAESANFRLGPR